MSVFWVYISSDLEDLNHAVQLDAGLISDLTNRVYENYINHPF